MVGLKRCIVALSVYLALTTIAIHADASNNFCATAIDKQLCEKMVKGAANWDEAMTNAITETTNELAKAIKTGNSMCKEAYEDTGDKLKESLETVRSGNKDGSLNFQLSAALTGVDDCIKILKDLGEDTSAAKTLNHGVDQAIRVCLAVDTSKSAA